MCTTAPIYYHKVGVSYTPKLFSVSTPLLCRDVRDVSDYLKWATDSFLLSTAIAQPQTSIHTHMCYCDFGDCMEAIDRMDTDVNSIENGGTWSNLTPFVTSRTGCVQQTMTSNDRTYELGYSTT